MMRRSATGLAGVLLVDKPAGPTSHDIVAAVRRATGERRIGHAGTLDPAATGLLLLLVGSATRLERYVSGHDKCYDAVITFGAATDTLDAEGQVTETRAVPPEVTDPVFAARVLAGFVGRQLQVPPAYSAIKQAGVASHRRARAGEPVDLDPRPVVIHRAELTGITRDPVQWHVAFRVSKGTYVRSLARDIGQAASTVAHLSALRRTASGAARVVDAHALTDVTAAAEENRLADLFADPLDVLGLPVTDVDASLARDGRPVPLPDGTDFTAHERVALTADGSLIGVYRVDGSTLRAETVLSPVIAL